MSRQPLRGGFPEEPVWWPGEHFALIWRSGVAVLDRSVGSQVALSVWQVLLEGAGLPEFLAALAEGAKTDLLSMPSFAVALVEGSAVHGAARGQFAVDVTTATGLEQVSGHQVSTWSERLVAQAMSVRVGDLSRVAPDGDGWPSLGGVVPADLVSFTLVAGAPKLLSPVVVADDAASDASQPALTEGPSADASPEAVSVEGEGAGAEGGEAEGADSGSDGPAVAAPAGTSSSATLSEFPEVPQATDSAGSAEPVASHVESVTAEEFVESDGEEAGAEAAEAPPSRFGALFSDNTVAQPIEAAAIRVVAEPEGAPDSDSDAAAEEGDSDGSAPGAGAVEPGLPAQPAQPAADHAQLPSDPETRVEPSDSSRIAQPTAQPTDQPAGRVGAVLSSGFITSVPKPGGATPPQPASQAAAPQPPVPQSGAPGPAHGNELDDLGDHDGFTVISANPEPNPAVDPRGTASGPATPATTGATLLGALCAQGHGNPPQRSVCRVCGSPVEAEPQQMQRPSLGMVLASSGETAELHTSVVVGRDPQARMRDGELPTLLVLPYPHVTRSHVEIRLEGWSVLAVDLHSRNGTFLRRPGQPPVRLQDQPLLLGSEDVLDLGHGATLSFQDLP